MNFILEIKSISYTKLQIISMIVLTGVIAFSSCKKEDTGVPSHNDTFILTSPAIGPDSLLPAEYTCDGPASTLPLEWSGSPSNTAYFALRMYHLASPTDVHWYWLIYDIPPDVRNLVKNETGTGTLGTNSVNEQLAYAPPCSQGPGRKNYILTIYALSSRAKVIVPPEQVDMSVFLDSINDNILDSATMTVWYSRDVKK